MGKLRLKHISNSQLREINRKMKEVSHASISDHVEYFLKDWLEMVEKDKKKTEEKPLEEKTKSTNTKLPLYVCAARNSFSFHYCYPEKQLKHFSYTHPNLDVILKFKEDAENVNYDYDEVLTLRETYRSKYPRKKRRGGEYIYYDKRDNRFHTSFLINKKWSKFCTSHSRERLIPIRDYVVWLSDEDKLKLYEQSKSHRPKTADYLEQIIANDEKYQEYLKEKETSKEGNDETNQCKDT